MIRRSLCGRGAIVAVVLACCTAAGRTAFDVQEHAALERARQAAQQIEQPHRRAQALSDVARAYAAAGDGGTARELIELALEAAGRAPVQALRNWALHDIARAQARLREFPAALATIDRISEAAVSDPVLADVATAQMARGDLEGALTTARRIVHTRTGALVLSRIAVAHVTDRDVQGARSLAARIRDDELRARAFGLIAVEQVRTGDVAGGHASAAAIGSERDRALVQARMADALVSLGQLQDARRLLSQAAHAIEASRGRADWKSLAFCEVADAATALGEIALADGSLGKAFDAALRVKSGSRDALLAAIARRRARAGDHALALQIAGRVSEPDSRALLVRDIAAGEAENGKDSEALSTARSLSNARHEAGALLAILGAQQRSGRMAAAMHTVDLILAALSAESDLQFKAGALATLATAKAQSGDARSASRLLSDAMDAAASVEAGTARSSAYLRIAEALGNR
jgi:tetratricopeptide (TPR) repeat protein